MNDVTVFVVETLLGIVEILLILRLYNRVFGKAVISGIKLYLSASIIMVLVTILMKVILEPGRPTSVPPFTVLSSFLILLCYPSNRKKKALFGIILFTVSCFWLILADLIITPLQLRNIWVLVLVRLVFWILLELINRIGNYEETEIPYSLWFLFMAITLSSIIDLIIMFFYIINREDPYLLTAEIPIMSVLLFINISLFVFYDRFSHLLHEVKEKTMLEQQLQMQNRHYKELEIAHNQIRTIQHDMKNYLRTVSALAAQQGNNNELIEFINETSDHINEFEQVISTGNVFLDSVINIKISEMLRENIQIDTEIQVPQGIKLSFEQTVIILGNLLDNAKEACQSLLDKERWVKIEIYYINHTLFIRIENALDKILLWNNGLPVSTKKDPVFHGLGLKNIKKIIEETGTMNIETTPHSFLVRIVLYDQ